jgi:hypothetical protein
LLGVGQHLVDAAARLDGTGDGQMAVFFEQQPAGEFDAVAPIEGPLQGRDGGDPDSMMPWLARVSGKASHR